MGACWFIEWIDSSIWLGLPKVCRGPFVRLGAESHFRAECYEKS